MVAWIVLMQA